MVNKINASTLSSCRRRYWFAVIASMFVVLGTLRHVDAAPKNNKKAQAKKAKQKQADKKKNAQAKKPNKENEAEGAKGAKILQSEHQSGYYGIETGGKRIVYVLDNSNSMKEGRFNAAAFELLKSVDELTEDQYFYVVLFSDTAYRLGHPQSSKDMIVPTTTNKRKLDYWLATVELCLKTNAAPAVKAALALKPDTIYILTDGKFTDDTLKVLNKLKLKNTKIHTIGMNMTDAKAEKDLKSIAKKFGGEYRAVSLKGDEQKKFLRPQRPKNNSRGKVWGVKLK